MNSKLSLSIAAILAGTVYVGSIDERYPSCILSMPAGATTASVCPLKDKPAYLHIERKAIPLALTGSLTGVTFSTSMSTGHLTNSTPPVAMAAAACPEKEQGPLDDEPPVPGTMASEMPFLLRHSSANFFNHQLYPKRPQFIQPQQESNHIVVSPPPQCPDKDEAPLHLERKERIADAGAGTFQSGAFRPTSFQVRPQSFENPVPPFMPKRPNTLITILTPQVHKTA
jgi:hypothetical protein